MRHVLVLDDHRSFHLSVARAVLAGGALALLAALVPLSPWLWGVLAVLLLGAAVAPPRDLRQGSLLGLCAVLGAGATALQPHSATLAAAGLSLCLGAAVAHGDLPRGQRLLVVLSGTLLFYGAERLPAAWGALDLAQGLPGQLGTLLGGMGMGLLFGSVAAVRQLRHSLDPVDRELRGLLPPAANGPADEIAALVQQAFAAYQEAAFALEADPAARGAAEDLVKKIARFGRRWREIEAQAHKSDRAQLRARLADLQQRAQSSNDDQARSEYERAGAALTAQLQYLEEIGKGRERAVARLHHQVATLERLRLAALRHHSVDAGKLGEELKTVLEDVGRAGQELDTAAEALAELPA